MICVPWDLLTTWPWAFPDSSISFCFPIHILSVFPVFSKRDKIAQNTKECVINSVLKIDEVLLCSPFFQDCLRTLICRCWWILSRCCAASQAAAFKIFPWLLMTTHLWMPCWRPAHHSGLSLWTSSLQRLAHATSSYQWGHWNPLNPQVGIYGSKAYTSVRLAKAFVKQQGSVYKLLQ